MRYENRFYIVFTEDICCPIRDTADVLEKGFLGSWGICILRATVFSFSNPILAHYSPKRSLAARSHPFSANWTFFFAANINKVSKGSTSEKVTSNGRESSG
jgi:hypothetical protein